MHEHGKATRSRAGLQPPQRDVPGAAGEPLRTHSPAAPRSLEASVPLLLCIPKELC